MVFNFKGSNQNSLGQYEPFEFSNISLKFNRINDLLIIEGVFADLGLQHFFGVLSIDSDSSVRCDATSKIFGDCVFNFASEPESADNIMTRIINYKGSGKIYQVKSKNMNNNNFITNTTLSEEPCGQKENPTSPTQVCCYCNGKQNCECAIDACPFPKDFNFKKCEQTIKCKCAKKYLVDDEDIYFCVPGTECKQ